MRPTTFVIGFAGLFAHGGTAAPVATSVSGDLRVTGFLGQNFDSTGRDGAWYSVISDVSHQPELPSTQINMRVTSPIASLPQIAYITGLSVLTTDADGLDHSIVIRVTDPHSLESSCPVGMSPCLADGALTVEIDGEEALRAPGTVQVGSGVAVSAVNLPGACRSFGFETESAVKVEEQTTASRRRRLSAVTGLQDMAYWILGGPEVADLVECTEYVAFATTTGEHGLFAHDSEHASFQIMTPGALIRLSHGRLHRLSMRDLTDEFDLLPERRTWRMDLALEETGFNSDVTGILGGNNARRKPILHGEQPIRGAREEYRVVGPLEIFAQEKENHE
eukprot:g10005.t1